MGVNGTFRASGLYIYYFNCIVHRTGKPDRPDNLKLTATAVSLTVEWDRSFNGGLLQTFHLGYGGSQQPIQDDNLVENYHYAVRLGTDEGIMIVNNVMNRTLALIKR